MRLESQAALSEFDYSEKEFGTGLRARLEVARAETGESDRPVLVGIPTGAPRVSPDLALAQADIDLADLPEAQALLNAPLGVLLADERLVGPWDVDFALGRGRISGKRLGEVLVEHNLVPPADVIRLVAGQRGLPFVDVRRVAVDPAAQELLPFELAREQQALPIGFVRGLPVVAVADPTDDDAMDAARALLHIVRFVASPEDAIRFQLARLYPGLADRLR
jgi:MshEN domain